MSSALRALRRPEPPRWIDRLRAELREEFSGPLILAAAGGPALTGTACAVPDCGRAGIAYGLCPAHIKHWEAAGRPALGEWAPRAPARRKGVRPLRSCEVPDCRRGRAEGGLCQAHHARWKRAGRPELAVWACDAGPPLAPVAVCPLFGCGLGAEGRIGLCRSHTSRWYAHGRPPIDEFIRECETYAHDHFDLRHLPPVMRAELAYGLQRRADERRTQTRPDQLARLLTRLPAGVDSLRQREAEEWLTVLGWHDRKSCARRFLTDTLGWLEDLAVGVGWESEYERDVWQLRRLGYPQP